MVKKLLIAIIAAIDIALLVLIIIGAVDAKKAAGSPEPSRPAVTQKADDTGRPGPATEPPATEPPATEPPATEPPATEPPATEPPATEPPATEPPETKPEYPASKEVSVDGCPEEGDLEGLELNDKNRLVWTGLTENAVKISSFKAVKGGWKCYMIEDVNDPDDDLIYFCNLNISGSSDSAKVTIRWMYWYDGESGLEEDEAEDYVYEGGWKSGKLTASDGKFEIEIKSFRLENGREYAVGTIDWGDGAVGVFALVRP